MELEHGTTYLLDGDEYVYDKLSVFDLHEGASGALYALDGEPEFIVVGDKLIRAGTGIHSADVSELTYSH